MAPTTLPFIVSNEVMPDFSLAVTAISKAMDTIGLKENLVQLSQTTKGASVQFDRVYAEQFATFIQEIRKKGLKIVSAELKAFSVGKERLFSVSLIIGGEA